MPTLNSDDFPPGAAGGAARVQSVDSEAELDELVRNLLDPGRRRPVVVVTAPSDRDQPYIDADAVAAEAGSEADVYLLRTGPLTFRMANALGPMACVYGGAGRLYAPGDAWLKDPYTSKLRFARDEHEGGTATEELIGDVLGSLFRTAAVPLGRPDTSSKSATGRVSALVADTRALVTLDDDQFATIWSDLVLPGSPLERLIGVGMAVDGIVDLDTRRLDVTGMRLSPDDALAAYHGGAVVLARVRHLQRDRVDVELYPGVTAVLDAADVTANQLDNLTELMSPGEAVAVRVEDRPTAEQAGWRLTMVDVDDDEAILPAPPVLRGGPAWLLLADPTAPVAAPAAVSQLPPALSEAPTVAAASAALPTAAPAAAAAASPSTAPAGDLAALRRQIQDLSGEKALLEAERREQRTKVRALQTEVERLRTRVRDAKAKARRGAAALPESAGFADPEGQLRWDVQRTWVDRVAAADKANLPLRAYSVGPQFVESVQRLEGITRDRVLQVVVDVLVGRPPAETHPLRRSFGADDRPVTRGDAVCMRVPLQTGTPSARRLHYWKGPGEQVELGRVVVHDDFDP